MKYDFYYLRGIPTKNLISCKVIFMEPMGDTKKTFNWVDNKTNASEYKSISEWKERLLLGLWCNCFIK